MKLLLDVKVEAWTGSMGLPIYGGQAPLGINLSRQNIREKMQNKLRN